MTIQQARDLYADDRQALRCPLCQKGLELRGNGLSCRKNHCFDLSAKGYANFVPNQKPTKYDKALFQSRQAIFADGFYAHVSDRLGEMAAELLAGKEQPRILDAGCGEGYYAAGLAQHPALGHARVLGLDLSKDAVSMAGRSGACVRWMAGDLACLPLADGSVSLLLNILTPANYLEFTRVLEPDGLVLKIIPGDGYLRELRACVAGRLQSQGYSAERVRAYMEEHLEIVRRETVSRTLPLSDEQRAHFIRMTPLTFGMDVSQLDTGGVREITIELEFLLARPSKAAKAAQVAKARKPGTGGKQAARGGKKKR